MIVDEIYDRLCTYVLNAYSKMDDLSSTYVPYYDSCIDLDHQKSIGKHKVTSDIVDQVQNEEMKFRPARYSPSLAILDSLPEFIPITKDESDVINTAKRRIVSYFLPPLIRMREWRLLFSINSDGVSLNTFYARLKNRDNTVLLIKDEQGNIFGAYCCEAWHMSNYFYGRGESFVFSFHNEDDLQVYMWTGHDE